MASQKNILELYEVKRYNFKAFEYNISNSLLA